MSFSTPFVSVSFSIIVEISDMTVADVSATGNVSEMKSGHDFY